MRVLFVTHSFPRFEGDGAGEFILRLAVALRDMNVQVEVLAPSAPGLDATTTIAGIPVTRFRYAPRSWETLAYEGTMAEQVSGSLKGKLALLGFIAGARRAIRRAMRSSKPDVVHVHWWFPCGVAAALTSSARPLVITMHGSDVRLAAKSAVAPSAFRRVLRRASAVTAVSSWLATTAERLAPGIAVAVSPMPVEASLFTLGAATRKRRILFVGRLNAQKGLADLLEATAGIGNDISVDVVGDGPDRAALEARARQLGVSGVITWHGHLPLTQVAPLYRDAFVVVIPSREEGMGLVAVEALLSGTPVVAYRSGGLTDLIADGVSGRLVDEGSIDQLRAAIAGLMAAPADARGMGAAGRTRMLERFAPATVAAKYLATYTSVLPR